MRLYSGFGAAIGWFALALQLVLILTVTSDLSVGERAVNFFSYFTILSNILTALMLTAAWRGMGGVIARPGVQTAIVVYMTVTGIVYTLILARIWNPTGWEYVANALLHYVMPVVTVLFWFLFVRKGTLSLRSVAWTMVFPVVYAVYTLVRGPSVNWYPYPFIDASTLTTSALVINIIVVAAAIVVLALAYLGLDQLLGRRRVRRTA